jgi:hypothetical protein
MPSAVENMKRFGFGVGFTVGSIISIAISSWQYQNDAHGNSFSQSWDDICTSWPYKILRRKLRRLFSFFAPHFDGLLFFSFFLLINTSFFVLFDSFLLSSFLLFFFLPPPLSLYHSCRY